MGSDSAWRWRRGVEDKFHYRFWSQVVRPADVIDRSVNPTTIPTAASFGTANTSPFRPATNVNGESFWVHSLSLRLAVAF